jgi:hypothetical protein
MGLNLFAALLILITQISFMSTNPKENRTVLSFLLIEEFHRKGYKCEEIKEENSTIFIITHEKKIIDPVSQIINKTHKDLFKAN